MGLLKDLGRVPASAGRLLESTADLAGELVNTVNLMNTKSLIKMASKVGDKDSLLDHRVTLVLKVAKELKELR